MLNTTISCYALFDWTLTIPVLAYLLICAGLSFLVRIVHCFFKAIAIPKFCKEKYQKEPFLYDRKKRFLYALHGCKGDSELEDYWLGYIIGFAEVAFYPILIYTCNLSVIGAWLAIKTAGNFTVWRENQIAFNRFLVSNLLNLGIAYFVTLNFIGPGFPGYKC